MNKLKQTGTYSFIGPSNVMDRVRTECELILFGDRFAGRGADFRRRFSPLGRRNLDVAAVTIDGFQYVYTTKRP